MPQHMGLKLVGRIAAGQPIEAVEQHEELTFTDWMEPGDKFALRVAGDSMIDEHIADGDFVIIRRQEQARDGQIVAVRDEDGEATLKQILPRTQSHPPRAGQQDDEADLPRSRQHPGRPGRRRAEVLRLRRRSGSILGTNSIRSRTPRRSDRPRSGTRRSRLVTATGLSWHAKGSIDGTGCHGARAIWCGSSRTVPAAAIPGPGGWAYILEHPASGQIDRIARVPSPKRPTIAWS